MPIATGEWVPSVLSTSQNPTLRILFTDSVTGLTASDLTISGDVSAIYYNAGSGTSWNFYIPTIRNFGDNGGSFRLQMYANRVSPTLDEDFDWTFGWDSDGNTWSSATDDIVYPQLTLTLSETYIAVGTEITATITADNDIRNFTADDVSVTEGVTKGALTEVTPNREWTIPITAPVTGTGEAVVSIAENVVYPSNNAVAATFSYIGSIDADISLSAASAQNGEVILVQFDFDYDVPDFAASQVAVNDPGATVGNAMQLDDEGRCWSVPVTLPQAGEGMLEIELPEDAIGFTQAAVMAEVQFAPTINNNIAINDGQKYLAVIHQDFSQDIKIIGNNISSVDVQGLLRPFYHQWNSTTGTLSIKGRPTAYYKDLEFEIIAIDRNGTATATGSIDVIDVPPIIRPPAKNIDIIAGRVNRVEIQIDNSPSKVEVEGTWMNFDHKITEIGVELQGDAPESGLGVASGEFMIEASNSGNPDNPVSERVPWSFKGLENIYVFRTGSDSDAGVYKISPSGSLLWKYTGTSAKNIESSSAVVDSNGNLYYSRTIDPFNATRRVVKISAAGSLVWEISNFFAPSIYVDSNEDTYVFVNTPANDGPHLYKFNSSGTQQWHYNPSTWTYKSGASRVAVDGAGNSYLMSQTELFKVDPSGSLLWSYTSLPNELNGILLDPDSGIYAYSWFGGIHKVGLDGTFVWSKRGTSTGTPVSFDGIHLDIYGSVIIYPSRDRSFLFKLQKDTGITLTTTTVPRVNQGGRYRVRSDNMGNHFLTNTNTSRVLTKISSGGSRLWTVTIPGVGVSAPIPDIDGNVYVLGITHVSSAGHPTLYKYNSSGDRLWARAVPRFVSGSSQYDHRVPLKDIGQHIYILDARRYLYKIGESGNQLWRNDSVPEGNLNFLLGTSN